MKKFLLMIILLMTLAGCGNPSAATEKIPVPAPQTTSAEMAATNLSEAEETMPIFSDEPSKKETTKIKAPSTENNEEYIATTETITTVPVQPNLPTEEQLQKESKTEDEHPETEPTKAETVTSAIPETVRPEPSNTPVCESKSIYDYEFDVSAIRRELVTIGLEMGLEEDDSLTPDSSSWANPITASENFQGDNLERALKDYVRSMPNLVIVYGGETISYFNIFIEPMDGGRYQFYFLY